MKKYIINYKDKLYIADNTKTFVIPGGLKVNPECIGIIEENTFVSKQEKVDLTFIKSYKGKKVLSCKFNRRKRYKKLISSRPRGEVVKLKTF